MIAADEIPIRMTISSEGESHRLQVKLAAESEVPANCEPLPQTSLVRHLQRLNGISRHSLHAFVMAALLEKYERDAGLRKDAVHGAGEPRRSEINTPKPSLQGMPDSFRMMD